MLGIQDRIGLTISATEIELAAVRALPGRRWRLQDARRAALPPGTIGPQGQIEDRGALIEALRFLFPRPSRFGPTVNVSFDGPLVLVRQSRLKEMPRDEQQHYLIDQTRRYPNFEDGELALGYRVIESTPADVEQQEGLPEMEVLAVATRQSLLDELREVLGQVGIEMGGATSRALAAFGVPLRADRELIEQDKLWMAVTAVPAKLVISFWQGSRFLFYREVFLEKESTATNPLLRVAARAGAARQAVSAAPPVSLAQLELDLTENLTELRQLSLAAPEVTPVFEELERFVQESPVFNPGVQRRREASPVPLNQLIKEIKRSMSFHQVDDPSAVPVYLIDFPQAGRLCERIQAQEPALRVYPYRLDALPALRLGGRGPSVAAVGTALHQPSGRDVIDLGFGRASVSTTVRGALTSLAVVAGGSLLLLLITLAITLLYVDRLTANYETQDATIQEQTKITRQKTRALEEAMPAEGSRRQVQNVVDQNRRMVRSLAQMLDKDLRDSMPEGVWIESFNLGENSKLTITGLARDSLAVLDLAQQLKRVSYLSGVRLLELDQAGPGNTFRWRIVGTISPPEGAPG